MRSLLTHSALALTFFSLVSSYPVDQHQDKRANTLTAAQVLTVAPNSSSCAGAPEAGQCATAAQAAVYIDNSFKAYGLTSPGEQAAVLGTMAFESGDFKYNRPLDGTPGKGTRNMQSSAFNMKYAMSIPPESHPGTNLASIMSNPDAILNFLLSNEFYDFGSGAWFVATQCTAQRAGLQNGGLPGWQAYVTACLGTTVTPDRQAYFQRAVQALA